jgi:ligand-binding sensor domain-containing protein
VQGPQGYLWLATYDGLVRFDGVEFAEMSGGNSALPTSQIAKVHHGPEGRILARTETGTVARIDPERPAVTHLLGPASGPGNGPLASDVLSVRVAGDSALWLRTERTIYRRRESEPGRSESGGGEAGWTAVMPDTTTAQVMRTGPRGGLWVGTEQQGLWRVRGETGCTVSGARRSR